MPSLLHGFACAMIYSMIRKTVIFALLCSAIPALAATNPFSTPYAELDAGALSALKNYLPAGSQPIALTAGLLNNDQKTDYAAVLDGTSGTQTSAPVFIKLPETLVRLWRNQHPTSSRRLFVVLSGNPPKIINNATFLPVKPTDKKDEALAHIAIHDQVLEFRFMQAITNPAGGQRIEQTFQFKPKENDLILTRYQRNKTNRATAMFNEINIDWETGKRETTSGSMSSPRHKKSSEKLSNTKSWQLNDIHDALSFEP